MSLNYSDPHTRGNPANKLCAYDKRSSNILTGIVRAVSPLFEMEGGAVVFVHQLKSYVKADIGIGHNSHNNIGDHIPLSVGDHVRLCFSDGMTSNPVIIGTYSKQPNVSRYLEGGQLPGPDTTIEGKGINSRTIAYYQQAIPELGRSTVSVRRLEGTRKSSPVTGSAIASEVPGSIFASSPLGDETVIIPGEYKLFASNIVQVNTASSVDAADEVVAEAVQYKWFVDAQKELFNSQPFDMTGTTLDFNQEYSLSSIESSTIYEDSLKLYDEMQSHSLDKLREAQQLSQDLESFVTDCIEPHIDTVRGNWSVIAESLIGVGLEKLNDILPEDLNLGVDFDSATGSFNGLSVGKLKINLNDKEVSVGGQTFSLQKGGLSELNKKMPLFQQVINMGGNILIGDSLKGTGLEEIISGGLQIKPGSNELDIEGLKYSLATKGIEALNERLPSNLQVDFGLDKSTGGISSLGVGGLSIDLASGKASFDPSSLSSTAKQFINKLPPGFNVASRLLSQVVNIPGMQDILGGGLGSIVGSVFGGDGGKSIATTNKSGCATAAQGLPDLIKNVGSGIGIDLQDVFDSPSVGAYSLGKSPLRAFVPAPPHRVVLPINNLDFLAHPEHAVASLLTEYGLPNAGGVVRSLKALSQTGSLFDLLDVIQYSGDTPLFVATSLANIVFGRSRDTQRVRLESTLPTTCSGTAVISSAMSTMSPEQANNYLQLELGLPPLDTVSITEYPYSIFDWALDIDSSLRTPFESLRASKYTEFLIELLFVRTGRDLYSHVYSLRQFSYWCLKSFSVALPGAIDGQLT